MLIQTKKGPIELKVKDSRSASRISRYWNAFDSFASGRAGADVLEGFKGRTVTVEGREYPFITNPDVVLMLATQEPVFEDIYADVR